MIDKLLNLFVDRKVWTFQKKENAYFIYCVLMDNQQKSGLPMTQVKVFGTDNFKNAISKISPLKTKIINEVVDKLSNPEVYSVSIHNRTQLSIVNRSNLREDLRNKDLF